ncbi:CUB domain-containing protein, partial [uncultured Eubacterium sp.]|uniref:CUB domain-containing protein n=1 Tax=uncultured Eubacterium sp. TaxID=165185 RepID=UPI0025E2BA6F
MKRILSGFLAGLMILSVAFSLPFTAQAATKHQHDIVSATSSNGSMQYNYCKSSKSEDNDDFKYRWTPNKIGPTTPELSANNYKVYTYGNYLNKYYEYKAKGAQKIRVDFYIDVEPNYDFVEFYDANNKLVKKYSYRDVNKSKLQSLTFEGESFKIRMTSDRSNTQAYKGFYIDNIYVTGGTYGNSDGSGERANIVGPSSPEYDVNNYNVVTYGNNLNQYYNYHYKGAKKIKVKFAIDVEPNYDFVEFYDMTGKLVKRYSYRDTEIENRDWQDNEYTSGGKVHELTLDGNAFQIRMTSDRSNTKAYKGFRILECYAVKDPAQTMNTGDYTMITPKEDYPESKHNYADYLTENYAYRYPNAKSLKVKFSDKCKTEHNVDYITIYDANGNKIGSYSGRQLAGKTLNIPTGAFRIQFTSDYSANYYGFSIDSIEATMASNPIYTTGRYGEAYSNEITPRTAHPYGNYANETYYYTDATATSIDLQFDQVCKTEKNWDFITIRNKNGKQIAKLSGDQASNKFINIPGNSFSITFTSDRSKTFYGYSLYYVSPNYGKAHEGNNVYAYPESGHNYDNYANQTYKYVCPLDHVQALDLTFSDKCMTEENYDIVSVYDKNNNLIGSYSGKMFAGKSLRVPGNEFTIKFKTDRSRAYYGFSFDDISAVFDCDYMKVNELKHDYVLTQTINSNGTTEKVYACKNCQDIKKDVNLNFERLTFNLGDNVFKYDGKDHKPAVEVKDGNTVLREGVNYELSYSDTKNVGTQKMTVKMLGKYSGTKEFEYIIYENKTTELELIPAVTAFTAKVNNAVKDAKYELMYSKNSNFANAKTVQLNSDNNIMVTGLNTKTTYYVKARYSLEINGKTYYSDYGKTFTAKTTGTYAELTNLKVNTVDETDKAWGFKVTWDKVPGAEGYQILIKEWDYDWVNSKYDYEKGKVDNSHKEYTDAEIKSALADTSYGNDVTYSTELTENTLPSATRGNRFAYDYYENFYYDGVGYYTKNNSFATLQNFPDDRRFTISVRPVFENGSLYGDWQNSNIIRTEHKTTYSFYDDVNRIDAAQKTNIKQTLVNSLKEAPTRLKNPNTLRSNATYNGNIEFVDLTDKLPGDVQLQNLARRKCAFQIDEGCSYCDYNVVITKNYNRAVRGDFLDDKDYYIECGVKDYTKAPWGIDGETNDSGEPVYFYAFGNIVPRANKEHWKTMVIYYYWSEVEGCVRFNFEAVGKGTADDVIGNYLKNVRN